MVWPLKCPLVSDGPISPGR